MAYQAIPPGSSPDPWVATNTALLQRNAPQLTKFQEIKPGLQPMGGSLATAAANDGQQVGSSIKTGAGAYQVFGSSAYQTPKTTAWGVVFRLSMPTPVAGKFNGIGIANAASNHDINFGSIFAISATNYALNIDGAASTTVASTTAVVATVADYAMTFDATTIKCWKDGTLIVSTATLTNVSDEPMFISAFSTDAGAIIVDRILYGYIAP